MPEAPPRNMPAQVLRHPCCPQPVVQVLHEKGKFLMFAKLAEHAGSKICLEDAALSIVTASIAHQADQQLSAIVMSASASIRMLHRTVPDLGRASAALQRIITDAQRTSAVIDPLRGLLFRQSSVFDSVDLNFEIHEVLPLVFREFKRRRIAVRTDLTGTLPEVRAERPQVQQVLLHLLWNAMEAVELVNDEERCVEITTSSCSGSVKVVLRDSGPGFCGQKPERLFEPLFSTKPNRPGVGLSLSKSIIESHGGKIWGHEHHGRGAIFGFSLPAIS
jgi:C4-dicarboxylate-specific signal transduction histidine kinase